DQAATVDAVAVAESGDPQTRTYHHEHGDVEVYFEPHVPPARLLVVSATDVARLLRRHAEQLGYTTVLVEARVERMTAADREHPGGAVETIDTVALDDRTDLVLTDHDAPGVVETLATALSSPVRF